MGKSFSFHLNEAATQMNSSAAAIANEWQRNSDKQIATLNGVNWIMNTHSDVSALRAAVCTANNRRAYLHCLPDASQRDCWISIVFMYGYFSLVLIPSVLLPRYENIKMNWMREKCDRKARTQSLFSMRDTLKAFDSEYKSFIMVALYADRHFDNARTQCAWWNVLSYRKDAMKIKQIQKSIWRARHFHCN